MEKKINSEWEDRIREAMATTRHIVGKLVAGGTNKREAWGIAIAKASRAWCGNYTLCEFQREVALRFRRNYQLVAQRKPLPKKQYSKPPTKPIVNEQLELPY